MVSLREFRAVERDGEYAIVGELCHKRVGHSSDALFLLVIGLIHLTLVLLAEQDQCCAILPIAPTLIVYNP